MNIGFRSNEHFKVCKHPSVPRFSDERIPKVQENCSNWLVLVVRLTCWDFQASSMSTRGTGRVQVEYQYMATLAYQGQSQVQLSVKFLNLLLTRWISNCVIHSGSSGKRWRAAPTACPLQIVSGILSEAFKATLKCHRWEATGCRRTWYTPHWIGRTHELQRNSGPYCIMVITVIPSRHAGLTLKWLSLHTKDQL